MFKFIYENQRWLAAGGLLSLLSAFGQTFFISLFAGEIRQEYGLSHGTWGGIYALGTMTSAAVMVWGGALSDHMRVRSLGVLSLLGLALACFAMAVNSAVLILPLIIFALRFTGQGMLSHVSRVAMVRWFTRARGKALAISSLAYTLGEAILPLTIVALLPFVGWRLIWWIAGGVALAMIPVIRRLLSVERTPAEMAEAGGETGMEGRHWTRLEVLRDPVFLLCLPAITAPGTFGTALFFHQVHLVGVKSWTHIEFVALFPLYTFSGLAAVFAFGIAVDRFGALRMMRWYLPPFAVSLVILGLTPGLWGAAVAFVLLGVMQGGQSAVPAPFWAEVYGTRHVGSIKAMVTAGMVLGSAIGPGLTGFIIDAGVGFDEQLPWIGAYVLASAALMLVALRHAQKKMDRMQG